MCCFCLRCQNNLRLPSGIAVFFRFNEIVNIKESDVQFFQENMEIFIESSKTDQFVIAHMHS